MDQHKDVSEPATLQKDHLLLTLTIVNNFIKSHLEDVNRAIREQNTASVLVRGSLMRFSPTVATAVTKSLKTRPIAWLNPFYMASVCKMPVLNAKLEFLVRYSIMSRRLVYRAEIVVAFLLSLG